MKPNVNNMDDNEVKRDLLTYTYHRLSRLIQFFKLTKITIGLAGVRLFFCLRKFMKLVSMNVGGSERN